MYAYLNPSDSITAVLSAAITTTAPKYHVVYKSETGGFNDAVGALSDTAATIVSAPSQQQREIQSIDVVNVDTASCTVTISKVVSGTSYPLCSVVLASGDHLHVDECGVLTVNSAGNEPTSSAIALLDNVNLAFGDSEDVIARWSTGDASDHGFVLALGDTSQMLHITDKAAVATDWAVTSPTHPTLYIHSNTTPITDYLLIGTHNGTSALIDVVGGTTLVVKGSGLEIANFVAAASAVNEITITSSATTAAPIIAATGDDTDINIALTPKGAGFVTTTGPFQIRSSTAVTATVGGGTTGLIPAGATNVVVTSDDANKQISLPAASVGDEIWILVGATGCELISAVAAHKVNDVTVGATNEAALTATNLYWCKYVATNTWVVVGYTKLGAVQAALVPDSL